MHSNPTCVLLVMQAVSGAAADLTRIELVARFRGLMTHAADSSLILKPLALLSRLSDEQSPDARTVDTDQTEVSLAMPDLISVLLSLHTALKCTGCIAASGRHHDPHTHETKDPSGCREV